MIPTDKKSEIIAKLNAGIKEGVFPNAELLIAHEGKIQLHEHAGTFSNKDRAIFDIASLTKPFCTAFLTMILYQEKKISLEQKVSDFFTSETLRDVTIKQLLNHTSGLLDWVPFYSEMLRQEHPNYQKNKEAILDSILNDDNLYRIPNKSVYSDLGYILLGNILEKIGQDRLDKLFKKLITDNLGLSEDIFFIPLDEPQKRNQEDFIPTEVCALRKKTIQAQVMDRNCYVQGGISGHAGLFSNALTLHAILEELHLAKQDQSSWLKKEIFNLFCTPDKNRDVTQNTFTLGFETPTKGHSQSGQFFSQNSIGHLGYSGTSFWWDLDKDFWIILLTNRCMPHRKNFKIQQFRPDLHDIIVQSLKTPS